MLVLTFQVGPETLALDIRRVREVVPRVQLRPVSGAPGYLAGVFVYRGQIVPVIDLHRFVGAGECPVHLSSRIILVPHPRAPQERLLGLLAAQVADIRDLRPQDEPQQLASGRTDLGPVVADGRGILRLLDPDQLLSEDGWRGTLALPTEVAP